ncbi:MAG: hypothetical protein M1837_002320 [Sclerophora amabilis]|nr:MAG: hypothetical protein M1837_002320 [Sclerophora amabilis]
MSAPRILIYLIRRDLRLSDNPVLSEVARLSKQSPQSFTHLLPLYVFPAQQVEISGFLTSPDLRSPYPEARSQVGGFWRCGPHRARFLAESVFDLKSGLEKVGSGLVLRVGASGDVVHGLLEGFKKNESDVVGVWMTGEESVEEKREEREVRRTAESQSVQFKLWTDEKYYIDDRDLPVSVSSDLPDVFTTFRKMVEPLREAPRRSLRRIDGLPPLPPRSSIPDQAAPFSIPDTFDDTLQALLAPLERDVGLNVAPTWPEGAKSAHSFHGGETSGHDRMRHLLASGAMSSYKDTRNGLLGEDFSTKLSAWLALGCVSARQVHEYLVAFEDGSNDLGSTAQGYGHGENKGTAAVRFELLWRDYMRLCTRKFGPRLFRVEGFRDDRAYQWKDPAKDADARYKTHRFLEGRTGTGLIDASMRELFLTGYTSNRARQNVASFIAKHLGIDWRIGAEWYESMLVDYDVSSNWGNWQYTAGVGNDPRGEARIFNPVKQAFDYDSQGEYVKAWVPELRRLNEPQEIFQAWKVPVARREEVGLVGLEWVDEPLKRIEFTVGRGKGRRGRGGGGGGGGGSGGGDGGRGGRGDGGRGGRGRGRGKGPGRGGRGREGSGAGESSGSGGWYRGRGRGGPVSG